MIFISLLRSRFYCQIKNKINTPLLLTYQASNMPTRLTNRGHAPDQIGIWKYWFLKREENRRTRRKTLGAGTRTTKNSAHIWRQLRESDPGHIGGRRVLAPLPSLFPSMLRNAPPRVSLLWGCPCRAGFHCSLLWGGKGGGGVGVWDRASELPSSCIW